MHKFWRYKNYDIEYNFYGLNEFSVFYCGDDYLFTTKEEAEEFIDDLMKEES